MEALLGGVIHAEVTTDGGKHWKGVSLDGKGTVTEVKEIAAPKK